jgi:cobalt-zinc-cadmium efflux system membrane fusion protein
MNTFQHALRAWPFLLLTTVLGAGAAWIFKARHYPTEIAVAPTVSRTEQSANSEHATKRSNSIELAEELWKPSGITLQTPKEESLSVQVNLTGKVSLNEDRISHIYPMVEGTVDEVSVTLGQNVKADDLLVVIHSREIGQAKLNLYQARLQREIAIVKRDLQTRIADNTRQLIEELRQRRPIQEIESRFRTLTMGDYRERLLASYAGYIKSQADWRTLGIAVRSLESFY